MAICVMCGDVTNGYYDGKPKTPLCFEHYEDGTFANYLAAQQKYALDAAMPPSAEPDTGLESVPAVESGTQPRK